MLTISIGYAPNLSAAHRQRPGHALRIDTASGSEFFHAVKHIPLSFDKPPDMHLRSVKDESDASRLRSLKSVDLCGDRWKDRTQRMGERHCCFLTYAPVFIVS